MAGLPLMQGLGSGVGTSLAYGLAAFLGAITFGAIGYGVYYYMQFNIRVTVLEQTRTGYTVKRDWARQKSKKDGTNELQLWKHRGFGQEPANISYPNTEYFDTMEDGKKHIHLLQKAGDQYIPAQLESINEDTIEAELLEADERSKVLNSIENGYQQFKNNTWSEMIKRFANYGMVIVAAIAVVLILRSASETLGAVSSNVQQAGENFQRAIELCAQNPEALANSNQSLGEGETPLINGSVNPGEASGGGRG